MKDSRGRPVGGPDDGADDVEEFVIDVPEVGAVAHTGAPSAVHVQAPETSPIVDGPTVVRGNDIVAVDLDDAMLHDLAWRWSIGFGLTGCPENLLGEEPLDHGVLLLPARVQGWRAAYEARRDPATGCIPVVLLSQPGAMLHAWAVGVHVDDAPDRDRGGVRHQLMRLGSAIVAERWMVYPALAHAVDAEARLLTAPDGVTPLWLDEVDAATAGLRLDEDGPTIPAPLSKDRMPLSKWPVTPLAPISQG